MLICVPDNVRKHIRSKLERTRASWKTLPLRVERHVGRKFGNVADVGITNRTHVTGNHTIAIDSLLNAGHKKFIIAPSPTRLRHQLEH